MNPTMNVPVIGGQKKTLTIVDLPQQAFPFHAQIPNQHGATVATAIGMTKLEYAAIQIMSSHMKDIELVNDAGVSVIVQHAVEIAGMVLKRCKEVQDEPGK